MPRIDFKNSSIASDLRDVEFASEYLEQALSESVQDFIIAIRNVADANGGIGELSKRSSLGRESLYKSLCQEGTSSPYFSTIYQVLDALGLEIMIQPKVGEKEAA